jgi:hypothetical protein
MRTIPRTAGAAPERCSSVPFSVPRQPARTIQESQKTTRADRFRPTTCTGWFLTTLASRRRSSVDEPVRGVHRAQVLLGVMCGAESIAAATTKRQRRGRPSVPRRNYRQEPRAQDPPEALILFPQGAEVPLTMLGAQRTSELALDRPRAASGVVSLRARYGTCFELLSVNDHRLFVSLLHGSPWMEC